MLDVSLATQFLQIEQMKLNEKYKPKFWKSPFQHFWFWLTNFLPMVLAHRAKKNEKFLVLIQQHKDEIISTYKQYEKMYNRRKLGRPGEEEWVKGNSTREDMMRVGADKLTEELRTNLFQAGWPYRSLADFQELVKLDYFGNLNIEAVHQYWKEIELFLLRR